MEEFLLKIFNYIVFALKTTSFQLIILLGPLLLLALLMNFFSGVSENLGYKIFGKKIYTYVFAGLGTALHELGHAVFALIFGHKITNITLFSPNHSTSLGSVNHSYNPKNIYHNIGKFFIGIGPVITGSFIMYLIAYKFFGSYIDRINTNLNINTIDEIIFVIKNMFLNIKSSGWKSVLFLYVIYSITSSITLSKEDINTAKSGLIYFIAALILFNLLTLWISNEATLSIMHISDYLYKYYPIIVFSILLNILFIIFLYLLFFIKSIFI